MSAPTSTITPISSTTNVRVVGAHRAEARGRDPLAGERAGDGEREQDRRVAREHHVEAAEQVGEGDAV